MYNIRHKAMAVILAFAMVLSLVVPAYAEPDAAVSESVDTDIAKENTAQDNTGEDKAAPVEEQEQMDEVQAEEGEAAEDVEEAIPYILMLPAVEDVSYSYDEAHYSEEFSDPDFTVLLYEAGEDVSIKVKSDLKYELVGALDGSVFLAADMVKKGKAQFTMPENDLMVSFIIPEVKDPEVQAPAVEEPEMKDPEVQEPVDEIQDAEVADEIQNTEVSDEVQDAEVSDEVQDAEVADEIQNAEVSDEVQDAEVTDEVQDAEVSDEVQDTEVSDEVQDAEAADEVQDAEVADEVQDAEAADEVQDAEVADEVQDAEVADEVQDAEVADEVQDAEAADEVQDAEVSDEVQDAEVSDEVQDAEVTDEAQNAEVTDEVQDAEAADEVQDAEVSDEVQDAEVSDEVQDAEVTDEAQNAEVTDEVQDAEVSDEVQDAEVTDEVQDAEVSDEVQDAEVTDEVQDAEVSDEVQNAEVTDEVQDIDSLSAEEEDWYIDGYPMCGSKFNYGQRNVWVKDVTFDPASYNPTGDNNVLVDILNGSISFTEGDSSTVTYRFILANAPEYSWTGTVTFVAVAKMSDVSVKSDICDTIFPVKINQEEGWYGEIPEYAFETLKGRDYTVYLNDSNFSLDSMDLGYNKAYYHVSVENDGGFDISNPGEYKVTYQVDHGALEKYPWYVMCTFTVMDQVKGENGLRVHLGTKNLKASVTGTDGAISEIWYGSDFCSTDGFASLQVSSVIGNEMNLKVSLTEDGEAYGKECEVSGDGTVILPDGLDFSTNFYLISIEDNGYDPSMNGSMKSDPGWLSEDLADHLTEINGGDLVFDDDLDNMTASSWKDIEDEGIPLGDMPALFSTFSKTWTSNVGSFKGIDTSQYMVNNYQADGTKKPAYNGGYLILTAATKQSIIDWVEGNGYDFSDLIPDKIKVTCGDYGHGRWGLTNGMTGWRIKATLTEKSDGKANLKLFCEKPGNLSYQYFKGTWTKTLNSLEGYLQVNKRISDACVLWDPRVELVTTFDVYDNEDCIGSEGLVASDRLEADEIDPVTGYPSRASTVFTLDPGTYWIRESDRCPGCVDESNTIIGPVKVEAGKTTSLPDGTVVNKPLMFRGTVAVKVDKDDTTKGLEGAVFKVEFSPRSSNSDDFEVMKVWFLKSDSKGNVKYDADHYLSKWGGEYSDPLSRTIGTGSTADPQGTYGLPIGYLRITEVKAPENYSLSGAAPKQIKLDPDTDADGEYTIRWTDITPVTFKNEELKGGFSLQKYEKDGHKGPLQKEYDMSGAVYTVYKDEERTKVAGKMTTDANGEASIDDLPFGTYYVMETKAPLSGAYKLDPKPYVVVIKDTDPKKYPIVKSYEDSTFGSLTIHKSLEDMKDMTKEELDALYAGGTLANIGFKLTHKTTGTVKNVATDKYGNATANNLIYGEWTITETNTPAGYRTMEPATVKVEPKGGANKDGNVEFSIDNLQREDKIEIRKIDSDTGNLIKHSNAKFQILDAKGKTVKLLVEGTTQETDTFVTDKEGKVLFAEKIKSGKYTLVELEAPAGYYKFTTGIPFEVKGDTGTTVEVTCSDKPETEKVKVTKIDAASGKPAGEGFTFKIVADENIVDGSGTVRNGWQKGATVAEIRTDKTGLATSPDLYIGKYYLYETGAPAGYKLNTNHYSFTVEAGKGGQLIPIEVKDDPVLRPIKVVKLDSDSKNPAGEKFEFEVIAKSVLDGSGNIRKGYEEGKVIDKLVTDVNGEAVSKDLYCGTYVVRETVNQNGYLMNGTKYEIHVTDKGVEENKKPVVQVIEDKPVMRPIKVTKLDADSKNPAGENFEFEVVAKSVLDRSGKVRKGYEEGAVVDKLVTNKTGEAISKDLYCGTYIVRESVSKNGYLINENEYEVIITDDGVEENKKPVQQAVEDNPVMRPIKVTKLDADSKNPAGKSFEFEVVAKSVLDGSGNVREGYEEGTIIDTLVTDENGEATSKALYCGTYLVRETVNQYGYEMNETVYEVTVTDGGVEENKKPVQQVVEDNPVLRPIKVTKLDADSKNSPGGNFEFEVVAKSVLDGSGNVREGYEEGTIIDTLVTDANGEAVSQDLYCGTYVVRETVTQNGYLMNENEYEVVITDDGVEENKKPVEQVIEDKPVLRPIKVTKLDADSKNPAGENFEFEVVAKSVLDGSGNVREGYEEGTVIDTLVTDASGEAVSKDLYCGTYVVRETVNQNGYLMNENEYEVVVTDDGVEENKTPAWQVVEDEPMLKQIAVTKIDAATGDHCGAGFQFQIVVAEDCVDGSGNVREGFERDSVVEIITTDEDGIARSGDLYLGHYYVQEIAVTEDGYAINATKYPFTLEDHEEDDEVMCVEMNVADKPTTVELYKTDTLEGQPMAGVTFQIRGKDSEASESTSYVTDKDGKIKVEYLKPGTYLIQETATLPGYNLDDTVYEFTVDEYGLIDGNWLYTIKLSNVPDVVEIHKTDITTAKELPGAKLVITDQDGTVVDEWVSEETPHVITGLPAGTYHLTETSAPEGYETEEQITFTLTDSLEIQQVFMKDSPYREVTVSKQDITNSEELPGATLAVTDEDGNLVDEWVSAEEPHKLNLHSGKYILTEKAPADGYVTTDSIMFEVIKTTAEDFLVYPVVMKDERTKLEISKKDLVEGDDGAEVPGAKLEIQDKDGNVVEEWVSTEEPHYVELLPIGKYTLAETAAPDGYEVAEKVTFEITDTADIQKCVMKDKPHRWVEISKLDMAGEEEVYGAHLKLEDLDGNLIEEWVSGDDGEYPDIYSGRPGPDGAESTEHVYGEFDVKPHMVRLPAGTYVLTETKPADGYVTADAITFEVTERGTEGDYEVQKVSMFDDVTKVEISKQDVTNKKELPGAKLEIRDKDGKLVEEWVSTKDPHYIEKLPVGDYTLTETTAPDGYEVAETVEFTVQDTGEIQHVTMYDAPEVEVPKTGDSLGWARIGTALAAIAALIAAAYFLLRKNGNPEGDPDDGADEGLREGTEDDTEDDTEE